MSDTSPWWQHAVGYEVYIRSFADGNDDGIGDLPGLISRLDHLEWLGVDVIWVTPFHPSPMADYGYDVSDYTGIHPLFGTLDDFDRLIAEANRRDLKVVIDIVPNHTSDQHPWFQAARSARDDPRRDYYHWRDLDPSGKLPNNWVGYFGGPVWTYDEVAGQQYLHMFLKEQPDLNWSNPRVVGEFDRILRFWLDRGVSGFRIDVAQAMGKDAGLRSNPELSPVDFNAPRWHQWGAFEHIHDILQPETLDVFRRWRSIADEYGAVLIGETYVLEPDRLKPLLAGDGLHVGFWFKTMHIAWSAPEIRAALREPIDAGAADIGWIQASHDEHRPATRFGGGEVGSRRSLAFSTLLMGLPGMPFLYQAEELGIEDGAVPPELKADPVGGDDFNAGRDGCRTPVPWSLEPGEGFSPTAEPWLPSSHDTVVQTVAGQRTDPTSPLHRVRALIALRAGLDPTAPIDWSDEGATVVAYRRGDLEFVMNTGPEAITFLTEGGTISFSSVDPGRVGQSANGVTIEQDEAVVVRRDWPGRGRAQPTIEDVAAAAGVAGPTHAPRSSTTQPAWRGASTGSWSSTSASKRSSPPGSATQTFTSAPAKSASSQATSR